MNHHHNNSSIRIRRPVLTLMERGEGVVADSMATTVRKAVRSMDLRVLEFINNHGHLWHLLSNFVNHLSSLTSTWLAIILTGQSTPDAFTRNRLVKGWRRDSIYFLDFLEYYDDDDHYYRDYDDTRLPPHRQKYSCRCLCIALDRGPAKIANDKKNDTFIDYIISSLSSYRWIVVRL